MTCVEVRGLEVFGHHGVEEGERQRGQRFLFDLELGVGEAGLSDRIEEAVDYREVVRRVHEVSESRRYSLLEALAGAVADALVEDFAVERVRVSVRKPDLECVAGLRVEHTAATVERGGRRDDRQPS